MPRRDIFLLLLPFMAACSGGGGEEPHQPQPPNSPTPPPPSSGYVVSGSITIDASTLVDGDLNDPIAILVVNDRPDVAQSLPNPATVGGYVNVPGAGASGRSQTAGDVRDFYRIDAVTDQYVNLIVAEPDEGDADIYLWDAAGRTILAFSDGTGTVESMRIPASGTYLVEVEAYDGATNYVLSLGQAPAARDAGMLGSDDDFVPGEAIVQVTSSPASASQKATFELTSAYGLSVKAGASDRPSLLALSEAATDLRMKMSQATVDRNALFADEATRAKWHTTLSIKALRRDPAVAYAEPNYRVHSFAVPNDEYYPYQWHYALINLPGAWDTTGGSSSVTVAVIDTGVLLGHPDLAGQLVSGFDFIRDPTNSRDGDGIDANPDDPGDQQFGGSSFHGTHVAGTIAAASNNATGVAGVASGVRIMPLRVLGARGGSGYDIMQAVLYAAGLPNDSGRLPARRADVINLSLGGGAPSQAEQDVFSQARRQGVVIVAAAGNSTSSAPAYPASYQGVISVSAVGLRKTRASYSNYGASVDVAAPGGDSGDWNGDGYVDGILSTGGDDTRGSRLYNFRFMQGTSMAAPHVAGVVALMKSVNPALTPDDVDRLLAAGRITEDLGVRGRDDEFGYGLIDARKAVTAASSGSAPAPAPALDASPRSLSFGGGGSAQEILVRNAGTGTLQVTGVTATVPWIAVTRGASVDADGLGRYVVTVNRTGLPVGTHSGHVEVRANAGTSRIPVLMEVNARAQIGDAGQQYVLLLDPVSGDSRYQVDVRSEGGVYRFRFDGVAPGRYELYSGTDADNDGYVCDAGESCGAYRTLDQPSEVEVTGATSLEAFSIGFDATIRVNGTPPGTLPASATGFRRIR